MKHAAQSGVRGAALSCGFRIRKGWSSNKDLEKSRLLGSDYSLCSDDVRHEGGLLHSEKKSCGNVLGGTKASHLNPQSTIQSVYATSHERRFCRMMCMYP
ncbi:hypothetical protein [Candidatus Anaplasma sp. TIGMIC]|uniref:hypothetical protein n=1 Tax=Candidatus Anaplasma sp. TIGMIC TaxID=3020713 RepID=UPI00232ECB59|nr:hypothetical protein [Candidatus Anaplasma sp. TIGMIC]MDB1135405.1 hypothetical protein [Candidatus Anaplasma sp. TIGMIC]